MAAKEPDELTESIRQLNSNIQRLTRQGSFAYGFGRGIVTALGATIGVAIVLTVLGTVLNWLNFIPGIDNARDIISTYTSQLSRY